MINFEKRGQDLILSYSPEVTDLKWIFNQLSEKGSFTLRNTFHFEKTDLIHPLEYSEEEEQKAEFRAAKLEGNFFRFPKETLQLENDAFIHLSVELTQNSFIAVRNISIIRKLDSLVEGAVYIGGDEEHSIPTEVFNEFLSHFPNTYELNKYAAARISSVISSYVDTEKDYELEYETYLNKKAIENSVNIAHSFSRFEAMKYQQILEKLKSMLASEDSYSERNWQDEIAHIILLLYPKYIHVFKEVPIKDTYTNKSRRIDLMLVDTSGNTDIVEIKKPFDKCIMTQRSYRDNYIPLKDLSGTIMQIEKYILYLNKWGQEGERKLNKTFASQLTTNLKIKITNPSGLIIMGRKKGLSEAQLGDFEVIKRKYKNVVDIITYDDMIERLQLAVAKWTGIQDEKDTG